MINLLTRQKNSQVIFLVFSPYLFPKASFLGLLFNKVAIFSNEILRRHLLIFFSMLKALSPLTHFKTYVTPAKLAPLQTPKLRQNNSNMCFCLYICLLIQYHRCTTIMSPMTKMIKLAHKIIICLNWS